MFFAGKRGWVAFDTTFENAFFEFFLCEMSTTAPPARPLYPSGGDPSPQRTRTDYTAQAAAQAVPDARQTMTRTGTHARMLDTLHRSALDTRQAAPGRSGRRRGLGCLCSVSGKVYNFGRYIYTHLYLYFLSKSIDCSDIYDII